MAVKRWLLLLLFHYCSCIITVHLWFKLLAYCKVYWQVIFRATLDPDLKEKSKLEHAPILLQCKWALHSLRPVISWSLVVKLLQSTVVVIDNQKLQVHNGWLCMSRHLDREQYPSSLLLLSFCTVVVIARDQGMEMVQITPLKRTLAPSPWFECTTCCEQGCLDNSKILRFITSNQWCRLMQDVVYNGHKTILVCRESEKQDTKLLLITSPNVNRFSKFFTCHCRRWRLFVHCRWRGADTEHGDDSAATLPRQRCPHHPAVLAAVSLHQHVALQLRRTAAETAAVLACVGHSVSSATVTRAGMGWTTRPWACCRLSPGQSCTGAV